MRIRTNFTLRENVAQSAILRHLHKIMLGRFMGEGVNGIELL